MTTSSPSSASLPDKVLLVDDEESVLALLTVAFKRIGLETRAVATGEAALAALDQESFGALVTDKNLPGINGLEVIRASRQKQPHCAAILITGYVNTESVLEALRLGANDYILKPFANLLLVVQRVKQAIEHQRVAFERALLADALRSHESTLRATQEEVWQRRTEMDLFQTVLDLRIEHATRPLLQRIALLESDLGSERDRRGRLRQTLLDLAQLCRAEGKAVVAPEELSRRLGAEADLLG